ncbi:11510_t:CDS:10 [Funneliformis caledonium]|uniref:11510_t:CDS:1 n=1 Tax=Funneliformis caledonium TaxID=1117310 RepID=A0A9N9F2J6_9GLOM|nr:11510_t:CDS:10 [Funneliformis caledonium]
MQAINANQVPDNFEFQTDINDSIILVNPSTTSAPTSGMETNNFANQQPPIDLFQKDPSRPSDVYLGKQQCDQQDDENIPKFQANESLSNEHQERNKSENVISPGRDKIMNTNMFDRNINDFEMQKNKYTQDLIENIPNLYRLLDLCKDDGSNGLVDKTIISKDFLNKLCNDMVPSSFKSISEINYTELNSISVRLIGCYGNSHLISKLLLNLKIVDQETYDLLTASHHPINNSNKPCLRPGIYLLVVNPDICLVIHWPEVGCYEENAPSQCKKNMTNLHRYLTKVTEHQLCLMSDEDLKSFDWNLYNTDVDYDDDKGFHEFEVSKSQEEQDDFKIYPGFKMNLSDKIKSEIQNTQEDGVPLHPIVIESATNQSFVTRRLIKETIRPQVFHLWLYISEFSQELQSRLQGRRLYIDRKTMDMNSLEILIIHGLKMEDELITFRNEIHAAKFQYEEKKKHEIDTIKKDCDIILNLAWKKLSDRYRIHSKYSDKEGQIDEAIKINSDNWNKLKCRYILTSTIIFDLLEKNEESARHFNDISFIDFVHELINSEILTKKKFMTKNLKDKNFVQDLISSKNMLNIKSIKDLMNLKNISDEIFILDLVNSSYLGEDKKELISIFFEEYRKWKVIFSNEIKEILQKDSLIQKLSHHLKEKFEQEKRNIKSREFHRLCNVIEEKYQNNGVDINYCFKHELEIIEPKKLQITIFETSLEQADTFHLHNEEFYIPNPILRIGVTLQIDSSIYDFRKIAQFDNSKFLLILYNKKEQKFEMFFDTAQRLANNFKYSIKIFKSLHTDENVFIAINEPKDLIAIYDTKKVLLNVYSFNDEQNYLYARDSNIQLLQWYNNMIPNLRHFFFIKDTEELCFVEKGGRARIFNLITKQFRPAFSFPSNIVNVLSSPDGSCIVAFVKEKLEYNNHDSVTKIKDDNEIRHVADDMKNINNTVNDNNIKEICRAYVYFCTNFGGSVNKVVDLPPTLQSLEFLQFTRINKLQTHLMSIDLQTGCFNSSIVKIALEKTQYRFQERMQKQSLGRVRLIDSIIEGENTRFKEIVHNGEFIVLMGERFSVMDVLSDTKLKIAGNFKTISGFDNWMDFRIEPKSKLNGLIDAYKLMFEKYPVDSCVDPEQNRPLNLKIVLDLENNDNIEEYDEKFKEYISEIFKDLKSSTKKPSTVLKKFSTSVITFKELDIKNVKFQKYSSKYKLGDWIIQLCCLIPIQIAVARNNLFLPLRDGLFSNVEFDGLGHVNNIAENISFGWYEGIFKHFGDKKVKVVSSMGEQSCGKSFMLNHLVGTSFDGSAMRCTEGVWLSLVNTKEYIYVALDFEGINSLERSAQEDIFLTLFNTVISNLILFKNQFAINRDISSMFQRFQDGAMLFESDPKLFKAKLCVIIKDVPRTDHEGILREFKLRFSQLVSEEGEDNFISRMYQGGLDIVPWPMFNDATWFRTLSKLNNRLDMQEAKYDNARTFLQCTKVIMAKLKICDWRSLDENLIQIRVVTLKKLLITVISYGLEQNESAIEQLMNHDTGTPIDDPIVKFSDILQDFKGSDRILADSGLQLYGEFESFVQLSENLRAYFEENVQPRKNSSDDAKWFANLNRFINSIIERRVLRVQNWYMQNTAQFSQQNNQNSDIVNGKYAMEQEISKLINLWTLCGLTCHQCGLKCVKSRDHEENHDCLTDHKCKFLCHFTEVHNETSIPTCSYIAGHEGKHACNEANHLCGESCSLIDKRNCQQVCSKEIGHVNEHMCQSSRHYCGKACSLSTTTQKGDYRCLNKCIMPYEEVHDLHRCENETCPIQCPILDCQRKCQSNEHFHSDSNSQVNHFCGNDHQCRELCQEDGICKVILEPKKQEEVYKGLIEETSITFTKYIQLSERLKCNKKIPPNEFKHTGKHTHHTNENLTQEEGFHFCDVKCQFCEYFCTLPYGHTQIHNTTHGNMIQTEFTSEDNEFLRVGDRGTFVLCNLFCKDLGRHRHISYCQSQDICKGQDIQHINEQVQPNPNKSKDFITHKLFWERTGFKDPYSVQEQQEFAKCDYECPDERHHKSKRSTNESLTKSFCELPLFHAQLDPNSNPPNDIGYISKDGHHFNCEIPSSRATFHIIFVLDRSSSMTLPIIGGDHLSLLYLLFMPWDPNNNNHRLSAVYNAVYQFMNARINSVQTNQYQVIHDKLSLVLFNHEVIVPFENQDLTEPKNLLDKMIEHQPCGGTCFELAIQKAGTLISSHYDPTRTNIIIFLSDGECETPEKQLRDICKENQTRGSPLYLYTVLFSNDSNKSSLEEMANIAKSYHTNNKSSDVLRCQFTRAIDDIKLVNHFTDMAASLREHKPTLLTKDPII